MHGTPQGGSVDVLVVVDAGDPDEMQEALEDPASQAAIVQEAGRRGVEIQPESITMIVAEPNPTSAPRGIEAPVGVTGLTRCWALQFCCPPCAVCRFVCTLPELRPSPAHLADIGCAVHRLTTGIRQRSPGCPAWLARFSSR